MKTIINERPIAFATFFFIVGIALSYYLDLPLATVAWGGIIGAGLFVAFLLWKKKIVLAFLYIAVLLAGAALFQAQYHVDYTEIEQGTEYEIEGRVTDIQPGEYNCYTVSNVTLAKDETEIQFGKKVFLYSQEVLEYGDIIRFQSKVDLPTQARNPGALDEKMYLASKGVGLSFFGYSIDLLGNEPGPYGALVSFRSMLSEQFDLYFTEDTAPLAKAMFLGVKGEMPDEVREAFSNTGIAHVLAISGLHISVVSGALLLLLKKLKVSRNVRFGVVVAALVFYMVLTGLAPSVVRAVLMTALIILSRWRFKNRDTLTYLCVALLATLLVFGTPLLFMPGLLLSYGAVFALLCLVPATGRGLKRIHFSNAFSTMFAVSCIASLAVLPLTAYYFGSISWIAPLANFYAIPLASVIVVMSVLFTVFSFVPVVAAALAFIPQIALSLLVNANSFLAERSIGMTTVESFPVWAGVVIFIVIYICSDYLMIRKKWKGVLAAVLAGILIIGLVVAPGASKSAAEVTVLDVGTGDMIHIRVEDKDYLVDNGGNLQRSQVEDYAENNHITYEAVIVTNDRTNNLQGLVEGGKVNELYTPDNYIPKDWDEELVLKTYALYDKITVGEDVYLLPVCTDGKNWSLVLMLQGRAICLFAQNEAAALEEGQLPEVDVFKIAKGGSADSISSTVLEMAKPEAVVISVKQGNAKGLPDKSVLGVLQESGIEVYQTSESGAVKFTWLDDGTRKTETMK